MTTEQIKFDQWCILEIMGHQKYAGRVTEKTLAGASFLQIDIPAVGKQHAFSKMFSASSVYAITPTTEELATAIAANLENAPITVYELPDEMQAKLRAPRLPGSLGYERPDARSHDDDSPDDEGPF